jgi:ABC-type antimicrobial peptide transport system permease subunit
MFEMLTRDVRLAVRRLMRTPGFTAIALLSLSLGTRSLIILVIGFALCVGASLALTRFMENFLWGVTRSDPATFIIIAAILIGAGIVACLVPGTRATRIDPLVALPHD